MRAILDTRNELADALGTIDGVTAFSVPPPSIQPFMAWPRWTQTTPINDGSRERVWEVFVTVPGSGDAATVTIADELEEQVDAALWKVDNAAWTLVEPVLLNTGTPGDTVPALKFRVVTSS
jgi:hypothetical protein